VPWLKKHQRALPEAALPRGADKLTLYLTALDALQAAGYRPIGMDHFALPDDGLVTGAAAGRLHRNFMGYTTQDARDMLAFGVTSISEMASAFAQNVKTLAEYEEHLVQGKLPVERGLRRSDDIECRAFIACLLRGYAFRDDLHDLLLNPRPRLQLRRADADFLSTRYEYTGNPQTLAGLSLDPVTGEVQAPPHLADLRGRIQNSLKPHQDRGTFKNYRATWLRRILARNLIDEARKLKRANYDATRERSLEAALEESSGPIASTMS
jgi:hypothetical protein